MLGRSYFFRNKGKLIPILSRFRQDITPNNILVCRREGKSIYECGFKLADLGLSHIHPGENAQGEDVRGTRTYGKWPLLNPVTQQLTS